MKYDILTDQLEALDAVYESTLRQVVAATTPGSALERISALASLAARRLSLNNEIDEELKAIRELEEREKVRLDELNAGNVPQAAGFHNGEPTYWGDDELCQDCNICGGMGAIAYAKGDAAPCPNLLLAVAHEGSKHYMIRTLELREGVDE